MEIQREYMPITAIALNEKDAANYASHQAALTHLLVVRTGETKGELIGADGFSLAVVPVTLTADDVPGLIHPDALKAAVKDIPKREWTLTVTLKESSVIAKNGATFPRIRPISGEMPQVNKYPDIARIVPRDVALRGQDKPAMPVSCNFHYLEALGKALGGCGVTLWPNPIGVTGPLVVTAVEARGSAARFKNGMPVAPYGVLMPMHTPNIVGSALRENVA